MLKPRTPSHNSEEKLECNISQRNKNNVFGIELKEIYTAGKRAELYNYLF